MPKKITFKKGGQRRNMTMPCGFRITGSVREANNRVAIHCRNCTKGMGCSEIQLDESDKAFMGADNGWDGLQNLKPVPVTVMRELGARHAIGVIDDNEVEAVRGPNWARNQKKRDKKKAKAEVEADAEANAYLDTVATDISSEIAGALSRSAKKTMANPLIMNLPRSELLDMFEELAISTPEEIQKNFKNYN